jgi:flagellin
MESLRDSLKNLYKEVVMSLRINHNTSALNSHRNLAANQARLGKTLEKLSSGLSINRASEGPAQLVISEQMRAQIAGMKQAIDNSETAVSLIQTTEANMSEINNLLVGIRQLAIHAANEGVNDEVMLEADQREIENAVETINRIARQAQFGNKRLLDGSNGASGTTTGNDLEFVGATLETGDSREHGFDVKVTQIATKANVLGSTALTQELVDAGEKLTVIENG